MCGGEISLCAPPVEEENKSAVTIGDLILYSPLLQTQDEVSAEYFLSLFDQISMWDGKVSICFCKTLLLLLQHNLTSEKNNNFKMTWLQKHFKDYIYIYIYIVFCVIYKQELTPKAKLKQRLEETILLKKQD